MKVTFISTVPSPSLLEAAMEIKNEFRVPLDSTVFYPRQIDEELLGEDAVKSDLKTSDAVFVDIRGGGRSADLAYRALIDEKNLVVNLMAPVGKMMEITRLGSFSGENMASKIKPEEARDPEKLWQRIQIGESIIQTAGKLVPLGHIRDASNYIQMSRYWRYGGKENYRNLLLLLLREYLNCQVPKPKEPQQFPEYGIYHPEYGGFQNTESFLRSSGFDPSIPAIGILFYGNMHFDQCQPVLRSLIRHLEGCHIIPVFSDGIHNLRAIKHFFFRNGVPIIDAMVNLTWFRLNGGPLGGDHELTRQLLKELKVPVFTPACMYSRQIDDWRRSETGLSPLESIMAVIWPELDGCVEPIPCCGMQSLQVGDLEGEGVAVIDDRIARIASRIKALIRLKKKSNRDKRIAIIIYNYPPGEENLGVASYLDVFKSVTRLLSSLKERGYCVDLPKKDLHLIFQDFALFNSGKWHRIEDALKSCFSLDVQDYQRFFSSLPESMQNETVEAWGMPPGNIMVSGESILIPGIEFGNIFVGIQPARPPLDQEDLAKASHDKTRPPHHQYLAFYHWLERVWRADAVVHVGTHGLAEFTKGKEIGLSGECFPDLLIGEMPHLYFYHVVNTSEVVIAKRRLYGTTIGHNSPPFATSELYEDYENLESLLDEFSQAQLIDPVRAKAVEEKILAQARDLNLNGMDTDKIHEQLYEMKRRIIPKGLHVLGNGYSNEDLESFMEFILRYDRNGIKSINRILAEAKGLDYSKALRHRDAFLHKLDEIDHKAANLIHLSLNGPIDAAVEGCGLSSKGKNELRASLEYGLQMLQKYSLNDQEISSFLEGMEGKFIEQASGGDVIRSPEILPTGRNLTQFDPTRIPTDAAFEKGREIAENTISAILEKDGSYPETVAVILWGFETTKTGGESIGQILTYLGVEIERDAGIWAPKLRATPLEELGRPRIDCLVNICGFFRDMFPNVLLLMDQAYNLVASLDEPLEMNFVRRHSIRNMEALRSRNLEEKIAQKMANGRIFGPKAGEYGTRMLPLVEDAIWRTEEELAQVFIQSMNHLYAENLYAVKSDEIYRANLATVKAVSQVRDTHDREIIDLDHYYEFFGGLARAVQMERNQSPQMLISDTTEEVIRTEDIKDVVARGARTRLLNPKWAEALLKHEFHGAQQVADRVENMLGLAATTHSVENWIWSGIAERYIFDEKMREKLTRNNRFAAAEVAERLLEAEKRGYWQATEEEKEKLRTAYLEIEGDIEGGMEARQVSGRNEAWPK